MDEPANDPGAHDAGAHDVDALDRVRESMREVIAAAARDGRPLFDDETARLHALLVEATVLGSEGAAAVLRRVHERQQAYRDSTEALAGIHADVLGVLLVDDEHAIPPVIDHMDEPELLTALGALVIFWRGHLDQPGAEDQRAELRRLLAVLQALEGSRADLIALLLGDHDETSIARALVRLDPAQLRAALGALVLLWRGQLDRPGSEGQRAELSRLLDLLRRL